MTPHLANAAASTNSAYRPASVKGASGLSARVGQHTFLSTSRAITTRWIPLIPTRAGHSFGPRGRGRAARHAASRGGRTRTGEGPRSDRSSARMLVPASGQSGPPYWGLPQTSAIVPGGAGKPIRRHGELGPDGRPRGADPGRRRECALSCARRRPHRGSIFPGSCSAARRNLRARHPVLPHRERDPRPAELRAVVAGPSGPAPSRSARSSSLGGAAESAPAPRG